MKYICSKCGYESIKWEGKCSSCNEWGSLEEICNVTDSDFRNKGKAEIFTVKDIEQNNPSEKGTKSKRRSTGFEEFDRVLGGGFVGGQVVLMAGEPGIGKSTILLQTAINVASKNKVVYVSVEESLPQIYSRYTRLVGRRKKQENLVFSEEFATEKIVNMLEQELPALCIVDSIQALESINVNGVMGGSSQIRANGYLLTKAAKRLGIPIVIVGQITKDGFVAGPKVLEHIVDSVLNLQGDEFNVYRVLKCMKNRYGATNEIGVFEMMESGMCEVRDPSEIFLQRNNETVGSAVTAILKGTRVMFIEIQALTSDVSSEGVPLKRVANGFKKNRLDMLCAVLTRRGGIYLNNKDVFVNVVGGLNVEDPAIDLAVCAAIKSAVNERPLESKAVYIGEVGLTGEVRGCLGWEAIIKESARLGYESIYTSKHLQNKVSSIKLKTVEDIKSL